MHIAVDGFVFERTHMRGIARVYREVLGRLSSRHTIDIHCMDPPRIGLPAGCNLFTGYLRHWRRDWIGRVRRRRQIRAMGKYDVFLSTFFHAPLNDTVPEVCIVLDMIVEAFPYLFLERWVDQHTREKADCVRRSRVCLCISQATADELKRFMPDAGDVRIALLGSEHLAARSQVVVQTDGPACALYVGDRWGYKNFGLILRAMVRDDWPREVLLKVVGPEAHDTERGLIERMGLVGRVESLGRVDDETLAQAYAGATCLISPSLAEGFGFPVIEGPANGTLTVCSDIPVYREIAGEHAVWFDPYDAATLAAAVRHVHGHEDRDELLLKQKESIKRYSWETTTSIVEKALIDALQSPRTLQD